MPRITIRGFFYANFTNPTCNQTVERIKFLRHIFRPKGNLHWMPSTFIIPIPYSKRMIDIIEADLKNNNHGDAILFMLNEYATDIMGGGDGISDYVKQNLIAQLKAKPGTLVLLAYDQSQPIGLAISFEGFSTFQAKPLLNLHDFAVSSHARGKGVAKAMLEKLESISKQRGYCKITLEVLEGNSRAQKIYKDFGFHSYSLEPTMGRALFLDKGLG